MPVVERDRWSYNLLVALNINSVRKGFQTQRVENFELSSFGNITKYLRTGRRLGHLLGQAIGLEYRS